MNARLKLHLLLLAVVSLAGVAQAQGTAIGYQGRLHDNGLPATGLYDFTFTVFDAEVGAAPMVPPVVQNAVPVTNGLFNVGLDFGPGIFTTGAARWLEIAVRKSGVGGHELLTPRKALLPTPSAIYAGIAGSVRDAVLTVDHFDTGGVGPTPGQFLSYSGGSLSWVDAGVAAGDIFLRLGTAAYYNAGNVGLGTFNPAHRLSIAGGPSWTANGWIGAIALPNASAIGWQSNAGGQRFGMGPSTGGFYFFRSASDPGTTGSPAVYDMIISDSGRVGIGGGSAPLTSKLTVRTSGAFSAYGIEHTDGDVRLGTYLDAGNGAWLGTLSNHPLNFFVNDGLPSLTIDTGGATIMDPIGGYGTMIFGTPNGESGMSIRGGNRADVRFNGTSLKLVAASGVGPPPSTSGLVVTTAGNVGIGTESPEAKLDVRGTTRTCVLTITGGCDLAEPFPIKEQEIEKGAVVVIDDEHAGRLERSSRPYDRRVAGIVSGANGINPGITLHQEGALDGGQHVALSGRVYVQADAAFGAIRPGDLLTTSGTPGHAMRVADHLKAQGAILGKAMSVLSAGKGMVLVLVTLQ